MADNEIRAALVKLAQAIDRLANMTAGIAGYLAASANATAVDPVAAKECARKLVPEPVWHGIAAPPIVEAYAVIDRIRLLAEAIEAQRPSVRADSESGPSSSAPGGSAPG